MFNRFQKRYFILDEEVLSYFKDEKSSVLEKGQISLRLAKVDPRSSNDKRIIIYTGTTEIHMKFKTIEEKMEWVKAI